MPRKSENRLNWGDQFGLPKILSVEKVSVRRPENPKELDPNMDNPLHHYAFPNPAEKFKNNQARKFVWESLEKWVRLPGQALEFA